MNRGADVRPRWRLRAPADPGALPLPGAPALARGGLLLLGAASILVLGSRFTDLDLRLADWMFDRASGRFPWRDSWFAAELMHRWVKLALVVAGAALVLAAAFDAIEPRPWLSRAARLRLRLAAGCALLVPAAVGVWRMQSFSHCPWALDRYGGQVPYVSLLDAIPAGLDPGSCFPAAHATSALWLAGLCVCFLPHRPRRAGLVFGFGIAAGLGLGWVQQLRGAHFLSHTLWSAWIAAAIVWGLLALTRAVLSFERRTGQRGPAGLGLR